jgi:hypothetical protein
MTYRIEGVQPSAHDDSQDIPDHATNMLTEVNHHLKMSAVYKTGAQPATAIKADWARHCMGEGFGCGRYSSQSSDTPPASDKPSVSANPPKADQEDWRTPRKNPSKRDGP